MTAVLAQVHKATASVAEDDDLDLDPALAACVQLGLAGPHLARVRRPWPRWYSTYRLNSRLKLLNRSPTDWYDFNGDLAA